MPGAPHLLMVWIEIGLIDWVLIWIVFGGFKFAILSNGVGWSEFYVNIDWSRLEWAEINFLCKIV